MNKKYDVEYLPIAGQDLTEIMNYIMIDNPDATLSLLNTFDKSISMLEFLPYSGVIPDDLRLQSLDYRMLVIENYLVFYVVANDTVEIRRILHGKRKYDFLL